MVAIRRLDKVLSSLDSLLGKVAPYVDGTVTEGTEKYPEKTAEVPTVTYPTLTGTCDEVPVLITFSITTDSQQAIAGRATNKPTMTMDDYLAPWIQIYAYRPSPFSLWISPEKKMSGGLFSRLSKAIGLSPTEIELGFKDLDDRYFFECRSNRSAAAAYLGKSGVQEALRAFIDCYLIRFDDSFVKLVKTEKRASDYQVMSIVDWTRQLVKLASLL